MQAISGFAPPASWQQGPSHPPATRLAASSVASAGTSYATARAVPHLLTTQPAPSALAATNPAAPAAALQSHMPARLCSSACQEPLAELPRRHPRPLDASTPASATHAVALQAIPQATMHLLSDLAAPSHWHHIRAQPPMPSLVAPSAAHEAGSWGSLQAASRDHIRQSPRAMWQVGQAQPAAKSEAGSAAAISKAAQESFVAANLGHMHRGGPAGGQVRHSQPVSASTTGRTAGFAATSQASCQAAFQDAKYWRGSAQQQEMQLRPMAALQQVAPAAQAAAPQATSGASLQHLTQPESPASWDQMQSQPTAATMEATAAAHAASHPVHPEGPWQEGELSSFCRQRQTTSMLE